MTDTPVPAARRVNRVLKGRWGWVALVFMVAGLLAVGATRDAGPRTASDRVDDISRRVACPVCDGESVFDSRHPTSRGIRAEITAQVAEGVRTDEQIIQSIADTFDGEVLLVPRSSGIEALAWAIPAAALVCALAGLAVAFRRWQVAARLARGATDDDYALVDAALARERSEPPELDDEHEREHEDES